MQKHDLPKNWVQATVSDLGLVVSGGTPSTKEPSYWGGDIAWIAPSDLTGYSSKFICKGAKSITQSGARNSSATVMPAGSVHFSSRAPIGYTVISTCDISTNQGFKSLVPAAGVFNEYIYYYFKSAKQLAESLATGTTFKEISGSAFSKMPVPLPAAAEQQRIVAKIEELFSELDKGVENLRIAQQQLKVYRQALLKHAFEGKLTADWRAQNPDKLESSDALLARIQQEREARYQQQLQDWEANGKTGTKPKAPKALPPLTVEDLAQLPELPKSWGWIRMLDACAEVVDCHNKTAPYQSTGIPLVRTPSIRNMKLNFDDSIRYVSPETYQFWSRRCPPEPGDILFTREAPMGEAAIIPEGKTICMGQRIMLFRTYQKFLAEKYLLAATQSPFFKENSNRLAVGTGVKHLRVGDVERLIFPICSINEQIEIVESLDSQLSRLDQLEQTITHSLQQAEALRQSILKEAFSGQLVAQDPNDEPASVLLERIRAERAAQPKARGRGRKAKAPV